jgi:hypothetical protein
MKPQLKANLDIPKAVYDYITSTDADLLSEDIFYLLGLVFNAEVFKDYINEKFIKSIFDGLEIIKEEDNHYAVVKILTSINSYLSEKKEGAMFLKVLDTVNEAGPFIESMLRILNMEKEKNSMMNVLNCLADIIEYKNECVLYRSDLESFVDMTLNKLQSTYTDELRFSILRVWERILKYNQYFELKYKYQELLDLLDDYVESPKVHQTNKELSMKVTNLLLKN